MVDEAHEPQHLSGSRSYSEGGGGDAGRDIKSFRVGDGGDEEEDAEAAAAAARHEVGRCRLTLSNPL